MSNRTTGMLWYISGMEKYKTTWDLKLLYKSPKDPQIEKDVLLIEKSFETFERKYKNGNFVKNPQSLSKAFKEIEPLMSFAETAKPFVYFYFLTEINTEDSFARAQLTKLEQRLTKASNKTIFFSLLVAKIPPKDQKKFLFYPGLSKYKYLLEKTFEIAKYNLSEKEEQLESILSQPAFSMWTENNEKLINQQSVKYKGKMIPISKAESMLSGLPDKERQALYKEIVIAYKRCEHFSEAEINAIYTYKKLMDEKRGYKNSYSSTFFSYEIDEKNGIDLIDLVKKNNSISRKFYKLHAKLLGKKNISYADRSAGIGSINKRFDFDKAVEVVTKSFSATDKKYADILFTFLHNGQIDVFPRKGKRGGGYCAPSPGNPTFILLNHTDDLMSVETLAHEMGHAIHSQLSKSQPLHYQGYSMATAEVASTFFEHVFYEDVFPTLSEKEQVIFLHNRIMRDITTIFRQVACFNFERTLHEAIRSKGHVSSSEISALLVTEFKSYIGSAMDIKSDDGLHYVDWTHIRDFFYVFSYAYGLLVSKALFEKWKREPSYIKQIEAFLSAGNSMSPNEIFKRIGIDTSDMKFFEAGLKAIDADITKLEKLAKKAGMI